MQKSKNEIHYLNFIKSISICLVVYCHMPLLNPSWYNNYSQLLTYIAVPLFFMVNGAVLFQKDFDFKKHIYKMLHLFFVTRVWRLVYLLFALWRSMTDAAALTPMKVVFYFLGNSISGVPSGPLWFIRALLACYFIFPIVKYAFDSENTRKYLRLLCLAMLVLMLFRQEYLLWQEGLVSRGILTKESVFSLNFITQYNPINEWAVLYFIMGGLLHQKYYIEKDRHSKKSSVVFLFSFLLGSIWFFCIKGLISGFSGTVFNDFSKYGVDGCYQSVAVFVMVTSFFMFSLNLKFKFGPLNTIYKLIGRNTLTVYYMHYMGAYILKDYVPYFQNHAGILCNGLKTFILIIVCLAAGYLIKIIPGIRKIAI